VATGEVVIVQGRILDVNCRPVAGALVEIWQACHTGKYNHPSDPNTAALDPDFHYWGRVISNAKGEYRFKTIIPGAYPASANWMRPPHIHFKVTAPGRRSFTTQMYFAGNALNDKDHILLNLTAAQRRNVIVSFDAAAGSNLLPTGVFDITLNISGSDALTPELD
jgi:protocatechuate 3,4-dioxygenase beta subunit